MEEQAHNFINIARDYCAWAEGTPLSEENELKKAIQLLANLYVSILKLPNNGCGEEINTTNVTEKEWETIFKRFSSFPFQYYSVFFSPENTKEKGVMGDLADDFSDIYRDIKNGLWLYDNGHQTEAIWDWKNNFKTHWGRHVVSALHALHCYAADEYIEL